MPVKRQKIVGNYFFYNTQSGFEHLSLMLHMYRGLCAVSGCLVGDDSIDAMCLSSS